MKPTPSQQMKISILKNHNTSHWSGGSTTELFIRPTEATYSERNFQLRISIAKVDDEKSTFTSLIGVQRKLMVLDGEINLSHKNHHRSSLKKFDVDSFKGDWITTCIGTCTDFNVMTMGNLNSELFGLSLPPESGTDIQLEERWSSLYVFVINGSLQIEINEQSLLIEKGNLLVIDNSTEVLFPGYSKDGCHIAVCKTT